MAGDRGVQTGRDAIGNVLTTGDHNAVEAHVKLGPHLQNVVAWRGDKWTALLTHLV